jgi:hypothetical protein
MTNFKEHYPNAQKGSKIQIVVMKAKIASHPSAWRQI